MYKLKVFYSDCTGFLEGEVNTWLEENKKIEVMKILQSESASYSLDYHHFNITVTIFYKELNKEASPRYENYCFKNKE